MFEIYDEKFEFYKAKNSFYQFPLDYAKFPVDYAAPSDIGDKEVLLFFSPKIVLTSHSSQSL